MPIAYPGTLRAPLPLGPGAWSCADADDFTARRASGMIGELPLWSYHDELTQHGVYRFFHFATDERGGSAIAALVHDVGALGDPAADAASIAAALTAGGVSTTDVQSAIGAYTGLPASQQSAIVSAASSFASGNVPSLSTFLPLIAGGLALTGGFGAPVVAAVAGLLQLLPSVLTALGLTSGPPSCAWKVGGTCFQGAVPYGPTDPRWQTWGEFTAGMDLGPVPTQAGVPAPSNPAQARDWLIDAAFPWYRKTIGCELRDLLAVVAFSHPPTLGKTDPISSFERIYYHAWQLAAEMAINGNPTPDPYPLLVACANAWNAGHAATSTVTIDAKAGSPSPFCMSATYIELLLNGDVDGHDHPPVILNAGAAIAAPGASSGASSPSSTGKTVAIVAGVSAVAAVGAWFLLGKPTSWDAIKFAFKHMGGRDRGESRGRTGAREMLPDVVTFTTAPRSLDGGWTRNLGVVGERDGLPLRKVETAGHAVGFQRRKYEDAGYLVLDDGDY